MQSQQAKRLQILKWTRLVSDRFRVSEVTHTHSHFQQVGKRPGVSVHVHVCVRGQGGQ